MNIENAPGPDEKVVVVCATQAQFEDWCTDNNRSPVERRTIGMRQTVGVTSARDVQRLRGCQFHRLVWLSTPAHWTGEVVDMVRRDLALATRLGDNPDVGGP